MRAIDADEAMRLLIEKMPSGMKKSIVSIMNKVPTIGPEPQWIPCSERLPLAEYGESDIVLATCGHLNDDDTSVRWIRTLYFNGGCWCYPTGETYDQKVYAWMPLPEPYREGEL